MVVVRSLQRIGLGNVIALVEEAAAVLQPRGPAELRPLDDVRQVLAGRNVANVPLHPVAARIGNRVGGQLAVVGDADAADRNRAVGGHRIRVEQHLRLARQPLLPVQDVLILQTRVVRVEVPRAPPCRCRVALEVGQLHQPRMHLLAHWNLRQIALRQPVLRIHPALHLGRVDILHPAVGVAHLRAEVVIHLFDRVGLRVDRSCGFIGGIGYRQIGRKQGCGNNLHHSHL